MMAHYKPSLLIAEGRKKLEACQQPAVGAVYLMMDLFQFSQLEAMLDLHLLTAQQKRLYEEGIKALSEGKPLAHITGCQEFYGRSFIVTPDVLVPRPETEELVAKVLSETDGGIIADIGTGSGCIAVTLALELSSHIYAVDISPDALEVACLNAARHQADVTYYEGDLLQPLIARGIKLDVLVSNPPYIAEDEKPLMNQAALHDPHIALFADDDGLVLYKRMISQLPLVMNQGGVVFFEIGHAQAQALVQYLNEYTTAKVNIEQDINQLDRIIWFKWL